MKNRPVPSLIIINSLPIRVNACYATTSSPHKMSGRRLPVLYTIVTPALFSFPSFSRYFTFTNRRGARYSTTGLCKDLDTCAKVGTRNDLGLGPGMGGEKGGCARH